MTYFFTDPSGLDGSSSSPSALGGAGPQAAAAAAGTSAASTTCSSKVAAPRVKVGADVLPWWPARGVYLLLEHARDAAGGPGRRRRRRVASGRRHRWTSTERLASARGGPATHLLLPRRRPGRDRGAAAARARRRVGRKPTSNRCSPRRSTPSCPTSGIAMCRRRFRMRIGLMVGSDKERSRADRLSRSARRREGRREATASRRSGFPRSPATSTR